jgi:5-methylcytosine-specific restriction endonuclease McrA
VRAAKEWIGKSDDEAIPPRVKDRIFARHGGKCAICTRSCSPRLPPASDHIRALINGGSNRESNLQLLCVQCHAGKTKLDVAEKAIIYRKRVKHLGLAPKRKSIQSRGFTKSEPQRSASRPIERERT